MDYQSVYTVRSYPPISFICLNIDSLSLIIPSSVLNILYEFGKTHIVSVIVLVPAKLLGKHSIINTR